MCLFNKVAIVGTGLIGGSIGLAIKRKHLAHEVIGVSRHKKSLSIATRNGAIDKGILSLEDLKNADLVIFATPVNAIMALAPVVSRIVSKECIVSDVGSTKKEIVSKLQKLFPRYVGAHPLAGSEKRGVAHAETELFNNSLCIVTPTPHTDKAALKKIVLLWKAIGAKTIMLTPEKHDKALSFVSHLPHAVAFSLIDAIPSGYVRFASTGLKDTTRIAASEAELWVDILLSNKRNIGEAIGSMQARLSTIKSAIQKGDKKQLALLLKRAQAKRARLA